MVLFCMNGVHNNLAHINLNANKFICLSWCMSFLLLVFFNAYGSDNRRINNFKEAQMSIKLFKSFLFHLTRKKHRLIWWELYASLICFTNRNLNNFFGYPLKGT
jgi:hypothetical protein